MYTLHLHVSPEGTRVGGSLSTTVCEIRLTRPNTCSSEKIVPKIFFRSRKFGRKVGRLKMYVCNDGWGKIPANREHFAVSFGTQSDVWIDDFFMPAAMKSEQRCMFFTYRQSMFACLGIDGIGIGAWLG